MGDWCPFPAPKRARDSARHSVGPGRESVAAHPSSRLAPRGAAGCLTTPAPVLGPPPEVAIADRLAGVVSRRGGGSPSARACPGERRLYRGGGSAGPPPEPVRRVSGFDGTVAAACLAAAVPGAQVPGEPGPLACEVPHLGEP